MVRIFPKKTIHDKKLLLEVPYSAIYSSKGKDYTSRYKDHIQKLDNELYFLGRGPRNFICNSKTLSRRV